VEGRGGKNRRRKKEKAQVTERPVDWGSRVICAILDLKRRFGRKGTGNIATEGPIPKENSVGNELG